MWVDTAPRGNPATAGGGGGEICAVCTTSMIDAQKLTVPRRDGSAQDDDA